MLIRHKYVNQSKQQDARPWYVIRRVYRLLWSSMCRLLLKGLLVKG